MFLVHPGGPFWAKKDEGAWSIPKGEYTEEENPLEAAKREFKEETGFDPPAGKMMELKPIKQPSGKIVSVWAVEGDFDAGKIKAICFRWNGRRNRAGSRNFRKSIERDGFR